MVVDCGEMPSQKCLNGIAELGVISALSMEMLNLVKEPNVDMSFLFLYFLDRQKVPKSSKGHTNNLAF